MANSFDPQILNPIISGYIEELVTAKGGLVATKPCEAAPKPIQEYDGRMIVKAPEGFDGPVYIATISFYLSQADIKSHRARGALVLYLDAEIADKIYKAAGLEVPYDEDDESMLGMCGKLCQLIADATKDRLAAAGFVNLSLSPTGVYKNSISQGVEFSKDQNEKQSISFFFLKHQAIVVDWTLTSIPKK